jgi:hypothetical protein
MGDRLNLFPCFLPGCRKDLLSDGDSLLSAVLDFSASFSLAPE